MKINTDMIFCLSCASIFADKKKDDLVCSVCGNKIDREKYESLINYSYDAVSYGYLYRSEYQSQIDNGEPVKMYWIAPEEIIVYCALAALSGIIGNATYDFVKYLLQKIRKEYYKAYPSVDKSFFENDEEISRFLEYLKDYYNGLENVNFAVRKMIDMEIRADTSNNIEPGAYLEKPKKVRIAKLMELFRRNRRKPSPWELKDLSRSDFGDLWNSVRKKQITKKSTAGKKHKSKNEAIRISKAKKRPTK